MKKVKIAILMLLLTVSTSVAAQSNVAENGLSVETAPYVDLGLKSHTLWSSCNVGAERPELSGGYFAWGEVTMKPVYEWVNYFDFLGIDTSNGVPDDEDDMVILFKRYKTDGLTSIINTDDDVARVVMGDGWQMPSARQLNELLFDCEWRWTRLNGVNGFTVTGPSKKSIFIPATGCYFQSWGGKEIQQFGETCFYWSGELDDNRNFMGKRALSLIYADDYPKFDDRNGDRCDGKSVRAVYVKR